MRPEIISAITQLVIAVGSLVGAFSGLFASILAIINRNHLAMISDQVSQVHIATNSMKDQLVTATALASKAEGIELGRAQGPSPSGVDQAIKAARAEGVVEGRAEGMNLNTPGNPLGNPKGKVPSSK